jgi:hypothetical protein
MLVTSDTVEFIKNYLLFGVGGEFFEVKKVNTAEFFLIFTSKRALISVFTHVVFCMALTFILLIGCWRKITRVQQGYSISQRTLRMQRHLLISLTVQVSLLYFLLKFSWRSGNLCVRKRKNVVFAEKITKTHENHKTFAFFEI